ncbi:hypothetical protein LCM4573_15330 [Rhizobium sp. LCM 4573]|nr:hypothetical protein LCM4573_15330 [Rhizobium sp. LCM 4573]
MVISFRFLKVKSPPQPLPTRGRRFGAMFARPGKADLRRSVSRERQGMPRVFSPLVGEMAGRPEGDFAERAP